MKLLTIILNWIRIRIHALLHFGASRNPNKLPYPFRDKDFRTTAKGINRTHYGTFKVDYPAPVNPRSLVNCIHNRRTIRVVNTLKTAS